MSLKDVNIKMGEIWIFLSCGITTIAFQKMWTYSNKEKCQEMQKLCKKRLRCKRGEIKAQLIVLQIVFAMIFAIWWRKKWRFTVWHSWSYYQRASQRRRLQSSFAGFSPEEARCWKHFCLWCLKHSSFMMFETLLFTMFETLFFSRKLEIPGPAPCQPPPIASWQR